MKSKMKIVFLLIAYLLVTQTVRAQFLDFSQPARAAALGGNLVSLPEGPSAMVFNPAGLAFQERLESSARYESLFPGLENDSISTGNLTILTSPFNFGAVGASWDHLGSNFIQQDRFQLAWGGKLDSGGFFNHLAAGFSLSYLSQNYALSTPLAGVSLTQLTSSAFSFGAGLLVSMPLNLTLGLSADDLNQPNLGVIGNDRLPSFLRWGLTEKIVNKGPFQLTATAAQSLSNADLETQGGLECYFADYGVRLRAGAGTYQGAVGLGYELADISIDYAYLFSVAPGSQIAGVGLPGSHLLELAVKWGETPEVTAYNAYFQKAKEAEAASRWDRAFWDYQECLSNKPGDTAATAGRARALNQYNLQRAEHFYQDGLAAEKSNLLMEARNNFEMAVKLNPANPEYNKALDQLNMPNLPIAPVSSNEDKEINATLQKVSQLLALNKREAAVQVLKDALQKHPHQATLEMVLKTLRLAVPKGENTVPALSGSAPNVQLLMTEADIYLSKGRPDLAKKNLEEALKTDPNNVKLRQKLEDLNTAPNTVSQVKMKLAQSLYEKGLKLYLNGELDAAIHAWEEALKADPNLTKAQNNLVRAKLEKESEKP